LPGVLSAISAILWFLIRILIASCMHLSVPHFTFRHWYRCCQIFLNLSHWRTVHLVLSNFLLSTILTWLFC
jgi:hypothetical protein